MVPPFSNTHPPLPSVGSGATYVPSAPSSFHPSTSPRVPRGTCPVNVGKPLLHFYGHASPTPTNRPEKYYENGALVDDVPIYGKRSANLWQQQQHQQQQHHHHHHHHHQPVETSTSSYCWYHPLHSSGGSIQGQAHSYGHGHGHGPSPVPPSLVQINQINAFTAPHHLAQQQQQMGHAQNGSLDDEWKNIHVMLNCILGMVEKTKRALAILQRRGCSSPAAATAASATTGQTLAPGVAPTQNGNSTSMNGSQLETSTSDRDGSLKRLSGEIVAQTIRVTEDKVAEVKRKAEEAVLEVKRAAVAEVQRAVAVAVAESRANERFRVHRFLDLPLSSHRPHGVLRQSSFLRVGGLEASSRNVATPTPPATTTTVTATTTTTTPTPSNSAPSVIEDDKDYPHLSGIVGSSCWNCGRAALETCGGCGIARYCGSFCQHRDWEAGHHASCNNPLPRETSRRRSASQSPPRIGGTLSTGLNTECAGDNPEVNAGNVSKVK